MKTRKQRRDEKTYQEWRARVTTCPLHELSELNWRFYRSMGDRRLRRPRPISKKAIKAALAFQKSIYRAMPALVILRSGLENDPGMLMIERNTLIDFAAEYPVNSLVARRRKIS